MNSLQSILASVVGISMAPISSAQELQVENAEAFAEIFDEDTSIETLAEGMQFTEGPVWFGGESGFLIFSDIPANQLKKWDSKEGLSVFRDPSNNANGNTLDLQGRLLSAEHGSRKVTVTKLNGEVVSVVEKYDDKLFNSPNDVVVKSDGTVWFTDPDYGLADRPKEQPGNFVYRFDPITQEASVVAEDFDKPNGLCFSPDESKLYIADSGSPKHIRVFDVNPDGSLGEGAVFVEIDQGGPDGIRCDVKGRIWSSSGDGVQIFGSDGTLIARILLPKGAANLCFGGADGRTLFITARDSLYSVQTK